MKLPNIFRRRPDGRAAPIDPQPHIPAPYKNVMYCNPLPPHIREQAMVQINGGGDLAMPAIDPLETAAATLAKHGAEKRRLARGQLVAERNAKLAKWIAGHPRPPLAEIEAELAPLFERLDMRKAARNVS